jgi:hypothetical protein
MCAALPLAVQPTALFAAAPPVARPEIRSHADNRIPACVTPEHLTTFLRTRNDHLEPRFTDIARWYKRWGEAWRVRWDYAFFQMAVETNFLTYRQGNGRNGDVDPAQNNFAGIGTTGGGVPGDSYPDVKTGVLAHIQHLVAYSGERLASPVGSRTRLKQDDIVEQSQRLGRPVRFQDLARRWAVDRRYGESIEWVAESYRKRFCTGHEPDPPSVVMAAPRRPAPRPAAHTAAPARPAIAAAPRLVEPPTVVHRAPHQPARPDKPAALSPPSIAPSRSAAVLKTALVAPQPRADGGCTVATASYGGQTTMLIRSEAAGGVLRYTALSVLDGFEQAMAADYIRAAAPGGAAIATFANPAAAIVKARELCPTG